MDDDCECPFGQHQSPINIVSDADGVQTVQMGAGQHKSSPLEFSYPHRVAGCTILNNGYTVQINIGEQDTNPCTVTVEGVKYTLRQFHFHTPSEHTLDDRQYEMEMHLVHTTDDGNIAVLGYIFSVNAKYQRTTFELSELRGIAGVGDEEDWDGTTVLANGIIEGNDFLKQFWSQLPAKKCAEIPLKNDISFDHLFEASSRSVKKSKRRGKAVVNMDIFQYDGSLTTPPYSEGVKWMVSKSLHFINQKQLRQLSACWDNKNNASDCHECFDRKVQSRSHMTMEGERYEGRVYTMNLLFSLFGFAHLPFVFDPDSHCCFVSSVCSFSFCDRRSIDIVGVFLTFFSCIFNRVFVCAFVLLISFHSLWKCSFFVIYHGSSRSA